MRSFILFLFLLAGCPLPQDSGKGGNDETAIDDSVSLPALDADGDGYGSDEDCDDNDAAVHPDATEVCDDVDNDCDGEVDEEGTRTWYLDLDGDGYGKTEDAYESCSQPSDGAAWVLESDDCDDSDAAVHPGALEACNNLDDNCDGYVDNAAEDMFTLYEDADHDGYGDASTIQVQCDIPIGYVFNGDDCDDTSYAINPGATEVCDSADNDCDGDVDEGEICPLEDTDTGTVDTADTGDTGTGDTVDTAIDTDTGGIVDTTDTGDTGTIDTADTGDSGVIVDTAPVDLDGDGYTSDVDCNDSDAAIYPDADEYCNGKDDDCDGETDEYSALDAVPLYLDADDDGYGSSDPSGSIISCGSVVGYARTTTDCDDSNVDINPDADELCDEVDNDCDGDVDEDDAIDASTWYADADGDGYGDASVTYDACVAPEGYVDNVDDCDDSDAAYYPGAPEACNAGLDYNCDGSVGVEDADGDGFAACSECDDMDPLINPDADELCDGVDNDCDGDVDEDSAIDTSTFYADADGDGFGDASVTYDACVAPEGYVDNADDCDDNDAGINPDTDTTDADGDGYTVCDGDCSDEDSGVHPGAEDCLGDDGVTPEAACNGFDDDCDGIIDG